MRRNKKPIYLQITPFFPEAGNFRGPYVLDQVKAIEASGQYRVVVCKPYRFYQYRPDYVYDGIKVLRFPVIELPSNILPGLFNKINLWFLKRKLKSSGVVIKEIKVVHAHVTGNGFFPIELKKINPAIKTVLQHHGFDVLSLQDGMFRNLRLHRWWVKKYGISICNQIDLHVGVSNKTLEYLRSFSGIRLKDSYVLYNGVDLNKFYPISNFNKPNTFTIGCIGNFWKIKDQITLIKAVHYLVRKKNIHNLKVKFVGSGEYLNTCKNYILSHKLANFFEFLPEVQHEELNQFYNGLHLFVLPSYFEAFGCVYTEAFACGIPFIAVRNQGIGELIEDNEKNLWLIEQGNYKQLAQITERIMNHNSEQHLKFDISIQHTINNYLKYIKLL